MDTVPPRFTPAPLGGVLFVEDFDLPPAPIRPTVPAEPAESAEAAREAGYAAGWAEGRAAGLAEGEAGARTSSAETAARALERIAAGLEAARDAAAGVAEAAAEEIARLILGTLRAALPTICARHGDVELRALARSLLPTLAQEPRVSIRVNPHNLPAIEAELAPLDPETAARMRLVPTDAMAAGDVTIEWQDGAARREVRAIAAALGAALEPLGLLTQDATTEQKELAHAG